MPGFRLDEWAGFARFTEPGQGGEVALGGVPIERPFPGRKPMRERRMELPRDEMMSGGACETAAAVWRRCRAQLDKAAKKIHH